MLFDLKSGKRRRVVQVVFGFLAFIFFISFVGFGIGSDVSGGLFDALGIGGGGSSNGDVESIYDQQISDAQKKVDENPKDEKALNDLAHYRFLAGQKALSIDDQGVPSITEDTRTEWNEGLDAWESLLKTKPKELDPVTTSLALCAYVPPTCAQAPANDVDLKGAIATQQVVADQEDTATAWGQLAAYYYFDGNLKSGAETRDKALSLAKPNEKKQFEDQLGKIETQAKKFIKQKKEAAKASGSDSESPQLENPFGGLGGDLGAGAAGGTLPQASP